MAGAGQASQEGGRIAPPGPLGGRPRTGRLGKAGEAQAEAQYPGWWKRLLTHPVQDLENYRELLDKLTTAKGAIKVFCEVAAA